MLGKASAKPRKKVRTRFREIVGGYLREAKGSLLLAALSMLGLTLTELAKPWPLKVIIDNVLLGKPLPPYFSFAGGCSEVVRCWRWRCSRWRYS